jgi:hypothetical protein
MLKGQFDAIAKTILKSLRATQGIEAAVDAQAADCHQCCYACPTANTNEGYFQLRLQRGVSGEMERRFS